MIKKGLYTFRLKRILLKKENGDKCLFTCPSVRLYQ